MKQFKINILVLSSIIALMLVFGSGFSDTSAQRDKQIDPLSQLPELAMPVTRVMASQRDGNASRVDMAHATALFNAFYQREDIKPIVDQTLLQVIQLLDPADELTTRAYNIAQKTPLTFEDAYILTEKCQASNIDIALVLSLIDIESEFNRDAVGAANDRGYMQIIPSTERWLASEFGPALNIEYDPSRIFEPDYQFALGTAYLQHLQNNHGDNLHRILSEYNRGPYNLADYYRKYGTYVTGYSRKIINNMSRYTELDQ